MASRNLMLIAAVTALTAASPASAATGTIDATNKTAHFTGTLTEPTGIYDQAISSPILVLGGAAYDTCKQPFCDEHSLTLGAGAAQLRIDATSDAQKIDFELVDPTGYTLDENTGSLPNRTFTFDTPIPGPLTLRVWGRPPSGLAVVPRALLAA